MMANQEDVNETAKVDDESKQLRPHQVTTTKTRQKSLPYEDNSETQLMIGVVLTPKPVKLLC